jgi:tape measure domain-containing protein
MALSWTLSLTDKVSGPAKRAATGLDRVSASMNKARAASTSLDQAQAKLGRDGRWRDSKGKFVGTGRAGGAGGKGGGASNPFEVGLSDIGQGVGLSAAAAGVGVAAGAAKLGMMVQDAQAFRQRTMFALETILKSKSAAEQAYAMATRTALETGGDFRQTMAGFNTLVAQGFDVSFADQLMRAMADLRTLNPQANMEGITRAVSQIKTTGRLQGDELMQLAEAGLNVDAVYQEIAKSMGVVAKEGETAGQQVRKLQEAGKISSEVAIAAIMASLKNQVGGKAFGATAAERANQSLDGAIARAKTLAEVFLSSIKVDWSPIIRAVERVTSVLQGPAGAAFADKIGASLTRVIAILDQVTESDIESFLETTGNAFTSLADNAERVVEVGSRLNAVYQELNAAFEGATGIGIADAALMGLNGTVQNTVTVVQGMQAVFEGAWAALEELADGQALGAQIMSGLVEGITSGAAAVVDALVGAVDGAIKAAEKKLGIATPSRVMRDIGRNTSRGAALGIADELPRVEQAGLSLASAPMAAGQRIGGFVGSGGSAPSGPTVHIENLHAVDPAQALAEALREDLAA